MDSRSRRQLEPGLEPGRVAAAHRGAFDVWMEAGEVRLSLPGKLLRGALDGGIDVARRRLGRRLGTA